MVAQWEAYLPLVCVWLTTRSILTELGDVFRSRERPQVKPWARMVPTVLESSQATWHLVGQHCGTPNISGSSKNIGHVMQCFCALC